jgi:hypothetical protein
MKRVLDSCTRTVHQAIDVIKPALLHKRLCLELMEGCSEVNSNRDAYFDLQADDRLVCEQQVASTDRKAAEVIELARENIRLSRCLDNLEKRNRIYRQAKTLLKKAVQPRDLIEQALRAIETITLKDLKDFVAATAQDDPGTVETPYQVTLYAVDAVSLLLREAMPAVVEKSVTIYMAEDEDELLDEINSNSEASDVSSCSEDASMDAEAKEHLALADTDETACVEDTVDSETDKHVHRAPAFQPASLDPVARAMRKHREAVGLQVQTQRTHQQQAFLNSLNPGASRKNSEGKAMEEEGEAFADRGGTGGARSSSPTAADADGVVDSVDAGGAGVDTVDAVDVEEAVDAVDAEAEVKMYPRIKRQEVIEDIGKTVWLALSWEQRLVHMHEFYPPGWREREKRMNEKAEREAGDAGSVQSSEFSEGSHSNAETEGPKTWPSELIWLQSTCETRIVTRESSKTAKRRFGLQGRGGTIVVPSGLLARSRHRAFCQSLNAVLALDHDALVSVGTNAELLELLEPYLEMQRMSGAALDRGPCGEFGASLWAWLNRVLEFADAQPEHARLKECVQRQRALLARARLLYDVALKRRDACSSRLKAIKFEIGRLKWLRKKSLDALTAQKAKCKKRTKWPVRLRHHGDPPRFVVMVNQLSKINRSLQVRIADLHEATCTQARARGIELAKRTARENCDQERRNVLNPWCWYMPDGLKWAGRCHNKWFVEGMRVAVGENKEPGHIVRAWIHDNGKGKRADVAYDEGGTEGDVPHYGLTMLYPQQVPFARALEDSQEKFVSTTFETSSRTPILLNVAVIIPRLKIHWKFKCLEHEDARADLLRADWQRRVKAARLLQCFYRGAMHAHAMKKTRSWKSSEPLRAFRSQNQIKFKKMQARNKVFAERLLTRITAVTNMQRMVRGHLARTAFWNVLASIAEEERSRLEKEEKRRQEIQISNQIRARAVQKQKVKSWRCPRCPLGVSFSQRFTDPAEIAAHLKIHEDADAKVQQDVLVQEAERDELRRKQAMERLVKEKTALSKMRIMMENRNIAVEKARRERELRMKEQRIQKLTELFTIKYQRPILPSLLKCEGLRFSGDKRKRLTGSSQKILGRHGTQGAEGSVNYAMSKDGTPMFKRTAIQPPYPELRFVRNALARGRGTAAAQPGGRGRASRVKLPESISIKCTPFRIGRSQFCDASLDSPEEPDIVSKDHAIIFVRGSSSAGYTLVLADLHSTNGTFVDQFRVAPSTGTEYDRHNVELKDSALIVFGCVHNADSLAGLHLSSVCYQLWKHGSKF